MLQKTSTPAKSFPSTGALRLCTHLPNNMILIHNHKYRYLSKRSSEIQLASTIYIYIYIYISAKYTLYRLIHITVVGLTTLLTRQYYNDHLTMYVTLIISFNCMRQICYNGRCMSNARRAGRYVQRPQCVYKMCGFRGIFVGVVYIYKLIWVVDIQGMFSSISGRPFSIESVRIITCLSIEA